MTQRGQFRMAFDRRAASTQSLRALNSPIRPVIFRPTIGRLVHPHARELRKARFRVLPDPDGDIFRCRIFQSRDFVEAMVIELL